MSNRILTIKVGTSIQPSLALAQQMMECLEVGEEPVSYFGVGFKNVSQMLSIFTPKRWDLLAALRTRHDEHCRTCPSSTTRLQKRP